MADRENHIWGTIRVQLSDVQNYLLNGQYKEAVILDKEILELLVRMQIDKALMVSTNLEGDINQLFEGRVISAQARDAYHGIRAFGELAELGKETSAQDANDSFSMLRDALSSYVDESQGARERRSESNPQQESSPSYGEEGIRINPNSYGEEAPRLRTEGYGDRRTYSPVRESDDEGGLVIPIRRNSGRTSSIHQKERAVPRNGSVKRRVGNRNSSVKRKGRKPHENRTACGLSSCRCSDYSRIGFFEKEDGGGDDCGAYYGSGDNGCTGNGKQYGGIYRGG